MKKFTILSVLSILLYSAVNACDICGCGVGNFNPHMFPHLSRNFISVGYNYRYYNTHAHDEAGEDIMNKEHYNSFFLAGQVAIGKKFQVMGILPFQSNSQSGPEGDKSLNKIGDAIVLVNYRLYDKKKNEQSRQTIIVGAGFKLPIGNHDFDDANEKEVGNANFQAGTGSMDWLLNGSYNVRIKNWAITAGATYKINTENKADYRFGNRLLGVLQLKYIQNAGKLSLIPNLGLNYENMQRDKSEGVVVDHTGGNNLQLTGGLDLNSQKWAVGVVYNKPVSQNLGDGYIRAMPGVSAHLSYSF